MFRSILEFLALLMFFAVARAVIGAIGQMFRGAVQGPPPANVKNNASEAMLQSAGELRKDPVCGTFVPVATSLKRVVNGETIYFCSAACRDQFPVSAKA
jgi:uncharacterized protein